MDINSKLLKKYYDEKAKDEWNRLFCNQYAKIEFLVTTHHIQKHFPKKSHILDAGGGPGRYAIYLAKKGFKITLLDISKKELVIAKKEIIKNDVKDNIIDVAEGSICDLGRYSDNYFDGIICLGGPLSYITDPKVRINTIHEFIRITKTGNPIFISVMSRFGLIRRIIKKFPKEVNYISQYLKKGDFPFSNNTKYFPSHYFTIDEIKNLARDNNFSVIDIFSAETIASCLKNDILKMNKKLFKKWAEILVKISNEQSIIGFSEHFVAIIKKFDK